MMNTGRILATGVGVAMLMATTTVVRAQPAGFTCPKAGVLEERSLGTIRYTGAAPSDPYVCNRISIRNEPESRLFNFYELEDSSNAAVKAGMMDLLSGRKSSVSFNYTSPRRYLSKQTWTFVRREKATVAGKAFDAVVLTQEVEYDTRSAFHGIYTMWLDPKNGLWVKSDFRFISGQVSGQPGSYEDKAITLP